MSESAAAAPQDFAAAFAATAPALVLWAECRVRGALRQRIDVDDLVQEIGLRACERQAEHDPARGSWRQWLFGFANRVWLELLREVGRDPLGPQRRHGGDSVLPELAATVTSISRRLVVDEALQACRRRLEALDDDDRRLVAAVGMEGLSHAEAAVLLGIGEDACRKRWQRLRERLHGDPVLAHCVG